MTWAARYSRTETPEITIWRDGEVVDRLAVDRVARVVRLDPCSCGYDRAITWIVQVAHDADLRADIAARVPVTECEEPGCVHWAMPDGRCHHLHGGSDEL